MHTNLSAQSRKIFLVSMLGGIILILFSMGGSSPIAHAQEQGTLSPRSVEAVAVSTDAPFSSPHYIVETKILPDGTLIEEQKVNGPPVPPAGFEQERQPVGLPKSDGSAVDAIGDPGSPAYVLGCSSTAALDVARRQDNP
jgi:hypothetical protein